MLYNLIMHHGLSHASILNLFRYITFRSVGACFTAFFLMLWLAPRFITKLHQIQRNGQPIRAIGPERHIKEKAGTPTMGGLLIIFSFLVSTLLWADITNSFIWIVLFVTLSFGFIGFLDDYKKLAKHNSDGLSKRSRISSEVVISLLATYLFQQLMPSYLANDLTIPFFKNILIPLGIFFPLFGMTIITGFGNAVNFTDGLDGLVIVPIVVSFLVFALITYIVGNSIFADYLQIHYIPKSSEMAIFCAAVVGSGLGFLWFNAQPASIFMGDTGSLALGGAISSVAVAIKHELVLCIVGGLFAIETISVIIQVFWYKLTKKRFFLMAPIHHHFEKKGWPESKIVVRFWIISIILGIVGLITLKIR